MTDNADGTGAVATVSGGGSVTNTVTVYRVSGSAEVLAAVATGTRTGNGTIPLTLSKGCYFAHLAAAGASAGVFYFAVTDGLNAVQTRVRNAVASTIRLLTIAPARNVYEQLYPDDDNVRFPCVLVTLEGVSETTEQGLSTRDDIGRPVKVEIGDRRDKRDNAKMATYEYWRQSIDRCFRNQQLAGVPESVVCRIEPNVIVDPELPKFDYVVMGMVIRCVCREPRGVGA